MAQSSTFTANITVSGGAQTILINTNRTDGTKFRVGAIATGLNGTGSDLDFRQSQYGDIAAGNIAPSLGTTLSLTIANPKRSVLGADLVGDYILLDFEPNDATTGTIVVNITVLG